jgi:cbb3-type cytochrome oxidase subunit 3
MKFKKTITLAAVVFGLLLAVYYFDYRKEEKVETQKEADSQILNFDENQVNMLEIVKKDEKIVLHKSEKGWALLEPIQDKADNDQIEELIKTIVDEKMLATAKESSHLLTEEELKEYGLDQPLAVYNIKNNLGQSKRITVGTQKNFEGNSFLRVDSENKVYVGNSVWFNKAENKLIYYRDKRLYRDMLADITGIKVVSLRDHFELKRKGTLWTSPQFDHVLDQNKVREAMRKISETMIQDYVFDGEPSAALIAEKKLADTPIHIEFTTADTSWSVNINMSEEENAVFALTDRPTRLVKLDTTSWEFFGNLNLDALRDRTSLTRFSLENVKKLYVKYKNKEMSFKKLKEGWQPSNAISENNQFDETELVHALKKIHDLEISEFIDKKRVDQFKGNEMIILKSETDNLVFQLNWGPEFKMKKSGKEKGYYFARTQLSPSIFALEKSRIESLGLDLIIKKKAEIK